ncbi:Histidinol-phosphate aminotransferase [Wickerhamomyces ciferrii]|uniref:Histidinol-phosphate aminotransferase n=1 Tax=Wickerhamomyces ciferrii (strain ATCC 14091 / BCRC 22168 / CBS 111 / JCM 3599 / NBRC 0793 / NRRL Y-1031 F-60-10) TaxID=1206466 RepID=K0KQ56_WICCF|nr:Histidinol-phosphate aminotransferase [Wickerhamomyces ciferrii]CCH43333.1 Histidinol-phosphate aminotransferase [Wickerhamomyces ciferrii]
MLRSVILPTILRSSRSMTNSKRVFNQFSTSSYRSASAVSERFIVPKGKNKIIKEQTEYRQLPDDSQYIEKFYEELDLFQKEIVNNSSIKGKNFSDFEDDPNELIIQLELFIEGKIKPQVSFDKLARAKYERFDEFLRNVKITLVLNGGHPMIFDILLQSKQHFDGFDKMKKK